MVTEMQAERVKAIKVEFADEAVTAFGGLAVAEQTARRLGLWRDVERTLPKRGKGFDWLTAVKTMVMGLLTGSQGTYATEPLREDEPLVTMLGVEGAPEEATVWRLLGPMGAEELQEGMGGVQRRLARTVVHRVSRKALLMEGFLPIFGDGTLAEGSGRREATKVIEGKGAGLLWTTVFVGPLLAGQRLAGPGEGEQACVRRILREVVRDVVEPEKLKKRALVLMDSLHGDEPTVKELEEQQLWYIVGANKLKATEKTLSERPEPEWQEMGPEAARGWAESAVCQCWLQCEGWEKKRVLVGRRWRREGELIYNYSGVLVNLPAEQVHPIMARRKMSYAEAIWSLYDRKAGYENCYKDFLDDLALHYPPCREYVRNAGFYSVAALAGLLAKAVQVLAGPFRKSPAVGSDKAADSTSVAPTPQKSRRRAEPRFMRLWRFRRRLLTLPARIAYHARTVKITLLGVCDSVRRQFEHYWSACCRC